MVDMNWRGLISGSVSLDSVSSDGVSSKGVRPIQHEYGPSKGGEREVWQCEIGWREFTCYKLGRRDFKYREYRLREMGSREFG